MFRLIFLIVIVALTAYLIKKIYLEKNPSKPNQENSKSSSGLMLKCAHCNLHIPKEQGLSDQGNFFCNAKHRDEFLKD